MSTMVLSRTQIARKAIIAVLLICVSVSLIYHLLQWRSTRLRHDVHDGKNVLGFQWNSQKKSSSLIDSTSGEFLIPPDDVLNKMTEDELLRVYWRYINSIQILCRNQMRIGHVDDGGKELCLDQIYLPKPPCLVYSFGSNYQFDFDLVMHNYFGCEVFTYDPSMAKPILGKSIPNEITFGHRGLAGKDYINEKNWRMNTLKTILKENGHLDMKIDVLKVDIEGSEWEAISPFLEAGLYKNVKQILLEVHVGNSTSGNQWSKTSLASQLRVLRLLYEKGFRIFQHERNQGIRFQLDVQTSDKITTVNELSFVNIFCDQ